MAIRGAKRKGSQRFTRPLLCDPIGRDAISYCVSISRGVAAIALFDNGSEAGLMSAISVPSRDSQINPLVERRWPIRDLSGLPG